MGDVTYKIPLLVNRTTAGAFTAPSINAWGSDPPFTVAFYFFTGTGAGAGSVTLQVEFSTQTGLDSAIKWIPLGGSFTLTLTGAANTNQVNYGTLNSPLAKIRVNITAFTQATNADARLDVDLIYGP